jgi:nicotinate-nucleotide pyrophosphorylase (carboxylating)
MSKPIHESVNLLVNQALIEDIGTGDITAELIDVAESTTAKVITREAMVLCGIDYFNEVFKQVDASINIEWLHKDGDVIPANADLCKINGKAKTILTAERTALNFLQTLSATATYTHRLNQLIKHTKAKLLDTRKTIPGLRQAQKYAVKCGGGVNHRMGLYDAFLIKENHIRAAGSISNAVAKARELDADLLLEVEVENFAELEEALECRVPRIMLDNFDINRLVHAVSLNQNRAELEASGNVSEKTIAAIAETGVNYISVGKLTKDIQAIDLSLRFQ